MTPEKQKEILDAFNAIRRDVKPTAANMLKMTWSDEATETASRWASKCQFRNSPIEERMVGGFACGETLSQTVTANSWTDIIKLWSKSKTNFKYGIGPVDPRKSIYTYTQLIWYNSHKVGCAVAYCPKNTFPYLFLCHYCPSGNAQDKIATPYKEGLPCADCPSDCDNKLCTKACEYMNSHNQCQDLKDRFSCESGFMNDFCKATCKCTTEIMVWYSSHKIGCTFAYCQGNAYPYLYMCRYCPVGNILESIATPYKKGPPCGDCPHNCEDKLCTNPCKYRDRQLNCADTIREYGCEQDWVQKDCKASCECQTEIK
ncbi:serotriflin-like [Pogona vitticeps]